MSKPLVVKILSPKTKANYVEEAQDRTIFMAYAKKIEPGVFQKLHPAVKCRDYFGDSLYAEQEKKDTDIFGFKWGPSCPEKVLDRDKTRLTLKSERQEDFDNLAKNLDILYDIEQENGLESTIVSLSENKDEILIEGDSKWMSSIFLISLYTYLLKCMCYHLGDKKDWIQCIIEAQTKESSYLRFPYSKALLTSILKNLKRFGFDEKSKNVKVHGCKIDPGISTVHNGSGWFSCSSYPEPKNYYSQVCKELKKELGL